MVTGPGSGGSRTKRILLRPVAALGLWCLAIFAAPVPAVVDIALYVVLLYGLTAHP